VGVYQLQRSDVVRIGNAQATAADCDLPLMANLSREHARLIRMGEDWWIEPLAGTHLGDRRITERTLLQSGREIRLGNSVRLRFVRPSVLSATARLEFVSEHRPATALDGVILMSEVCVCGSTAESHIPARKWPQPCFVVQRGEQLVCRATSGVVRNGEFPQPEIPLASGDVISGDWFRFRVE